MLRKIAAIAWFALVSTTPSSACDMVPGREVRFEPKEKVSGWMVWTFTPAALAEGHMLTRHVQRRVFPAPEQEKTFLENEIGTAVASLYKTRPTSIRLDAPSARVAGDAQRFVTEARAFSLSVDFAGRLLTASGFMRLNKNRKDIALIVAFASPGQSARAAEIARNTMEHPGFDCTAGDGP